MELPAMSSLIRHALAALAVPALLACPSISMGADTTIALPSPPRTGTLSLEETLWQRRSNREPLPEPLPLDQLGRLAWAAQGISSPGHRTAPSAGALYPLAIYVQVSRASGFPPGLYRYQPDHHRLDLIAPAKQGDLSQASTQDWLAKAPAIFAITANPERTEQKYGQRAERYAHLEAGHAAQNLLLQATALNVCVTSVGAFDDKMVSRILRLPKGEFPLYLIPAGKCSH